MIQSAPFLTHEILDSYICTKPFKEACHLYIHVPNTIDVEPCKRYGYHPNVLAETRQCI